MATQIDLVLALKVMRDTAPTMPTRDVLAAAIVEIERLRLVAEWAVDFCQGAVRENVIDNILAKAIMREAKLEGTERIE